MKQSGTRSIQQRIMVGPMDAMDANANAHVLVVDDHIEIRDLVSELLEREGFRVSRAKGSEEAYAALSRSRVDLVLLDIMLPGVDGLTICRDLRSRNDSVPIIMLTAKDGDIDRVVGLEIGADDYVTKPFNARELLARVKALLRRARAGITVAPMESRTEVYRFGRWTFDSGCRELVLDDEVVVPLSSGEFSVLLALVTHPGRTLSRDQLVDLAKGRQAVPFDRTIDQQVSRLRRKLMDDARNPRIIKTVWGGGYMFAAKVRID